MAPTSSWSHVKLKGGNPEPQEPQEPQETRRVKRKSLDLSILLYYDSIVGGISRRFLLGCFYSRINAPVTKFANKLAMGMCVMHCPVPYTIFRESSSQSFVIFFFFSFFRHRRHSGLFTFPIPIHLRFLSDFYSSLRHTQTGIPTLHTTRRCPLFPFPFPICFPILSSSL